MNCKVTFFAICCNLVAVFRGQGPVILIILYVNETFCPVIFIAFYVETLKHCSRDDQENRH